MHAFRYNTLCILIVMNVVSLRGGTRVLCTIISALSDPFSVVIQCWQTVFHVGPINFILLQGPAQPSPAVLITPIVSVSNEVSSSSSRENYCVVIACTSNTRHSVLGSGHHISDLVQFNICCLPILFKIYNK